MKKIQTSCLVLIIILSSCQLQKVMVNVYTPSRLAFPPDVKAVFVTSRYVPATGPYEDIQWGAYESVDSVKWQLSESIVDTLGKLMAGDKKFLVKTRHLPRILRNNDENLPEPVAWEGLSNIAKKEYVQAVLIIEGFGLAKTPVAFNPENGGILAHYSVEVKLAIRVYEPGKMRMIDDSVYVFRTEFKGSGKTEQEALKQLPDDLKGLKLACSDAAAEYYKIINPGEISAKRFYYPDGDSAMIKAREAVREGRWGRAETKWKWLAYNSKDSVLMAKASYNMALACERDGRLNQALGFARRSQRIRPDRQTLKYIDILNKKTLDFEEQVNRKNIIKRW